MRAVRCVAAALVLVSGAPALAAARASCRIVVDARDDELQRLGTEEPVDWPSVDVLSADIATTAKHMTTVVRVRELPPGPTTGHGSTYLILLVGRETYVETYVRLWPDGTTRGHVGTYDVGSSGSTVTTRVLGPATVSIDRVKHEVRATFALKLTEGHLDTRTGRVIKVHRASAARMFPAFDLPGDDVALASEEADRATDGPRTYRAGSRSCVRVGS